MANEPDNTPSNGGSNELLGCPFCGSAWAAYSSDPAGQRDVGCGDCHASAHELWWNTRVPSPDPATEDALQHMMTRALRAEASVDELRAALAKTQEQLAHLTESAGGDSCTDYIQRAEADEAALLITNEALLAADEALTSIEGYPDTPVAMKIRAAILATQEPTKKKPGMPPEPAKPPCAFCNGARTYIDPDWNGGPVPCPLCGTHEGERR